MSNDIEYGICSLYEEYYYNIFSTTNFFRLIFYTPIIFFISVIGSVSYDYLTYNDKDEKKNK